MAGFNWVDVVLICVIVVFAAMATMRGFIQVLAGLLGFVVSLFAALLLNGALARFIQDRAPVSPVWAAPLAFVIVWALAQAGFWMLVRMTLSGVIYRAARSEADKVLALLPGALHGALVSSLVLTFLALLPFPGIPRQEIMDSEIGGRMVRTTMALQQPLEEVFGPAVRETAGILTVRPDPANEESVALGFAVASPTGDAEAEERMLALVNAERTQRGLSMLAMDDSLRRLARAYATEMFQQGYFSHIGNDGRDPFARMRDAGIGYSAAGENLALSPSTEIAHEGLMNSPGHRANILNPQFRKVGIGVVDGGVHGKMFVQEFTD